MTRDIEEWNGNWGEWKVGTEWLAAMQELADAEAAVEDAEKREVRAQYEKNTALRVVKNRREYLAFLMTKLTDAEAVDA